MKTLYRLHLTSFFILPWVIFTWSNFSMTSLAQSTKINHASNTKIRFIPSQNKNSPPPDRGTPPAKEGTGSRGDCLHKQNMPPLTRLVGSQSLKFTTKEHPTFWIYVPYASNEVDEGEFSLQVGDVEVYRTRLKLQATPGVVSINLPSSVPPLAVGKEYRWYMDINCPSGTTSGESPTPASLTGVVQRVSESSQLQQELNAAKTPLERVAAYANHGIWLEVLTELGQLRLQQPQNTQFRDAWIELLSSENVGLAGIAKEPIVGDITTSSLPK
jgi:Domain of Unknown Function (DUF928)